MSRRIGDCLKTICLTFVYILISNWYKSRTKMTLCCESTQIIQAWVRLLCRFCGYFLAKKCNKQNLTKHERRFWKMYVHINQIIRNIWGSLWTIDCPFLNFDHAVLLSTCNEVLIGDFALIIPWPMEVGYSGNRSAGKFGISIVSAYPCGWQEANISEYTRYMLM